MGARQGERANGARTGTGTATFRLGHRPALDGLRGLSTLVVVSTHLGQFLWDDLKGWFLYPGGAVGVDVFFALSGFLITALLVGELDRTGRLDPVTFLWRRARRLVPVLAVVVGAVLLATVAGMTGHDPLVVAKQSVWTLVFLQTWLPLERMVQPDLTHTWSLAVEMHFYVLWSLVAAAVALVARRWLRPVLAVVALAAIVVVVAGRAARYGDGESPMLLYFTIPNRLDAPLVGCLGGLAFASGWLDRLPARAFTVTGAVGLAGVAWAALRTDPFVGWLYQGGFTVNAALGTLAVVGAAGLVRGPVFRALTWRPLAGLGLCSYSVYLWHLPVFVYLQREAAAWAAPLRAGAALLVTAALSAATYRGIERPLLGRRPAVRPRLVVSASELTVTAHTGGRPDGQASLRT